MGRRERALTKRPIVVVDVETTGLHPFRWNNHVVELGAVVVSPALKKVWRGSWLVRVPNPLVALTREFWSAKKVHGKRMREMFGRSGNLSIKEVVKDLDWLHEQFPDAIIGGQNAGFDHSFIKSMYEFVGKKSPWDYHLIDLTGLAAVHLGVTSLTHKALHPNDCELGIAETLGLDPSKFTRHSALGDAELTADALIALLGRIENARTEHDAMALELNTILESRQFPVWMQAIWSNDDRRKV